MGRRSRRREESPPSEPVELRCGPVVAGGSCLARLEDGRAALVAYGAPGELVEAQIERLHPDYVEAVATRIIEASPDRVEAPCPLFGECGGCQLQHMSYPAQLAAKEAIVREQLRRIGRLDEGLVRPIVGAAEPWGYRNHVRFSTGKRYGDIGFISRRGRGLLKVEHCPISDPWVNELLPALQGRAAGLHQVQVRHNAITGSSLVSPAIPGVEVETGQKWYVEELCGQRFRVSASAFFQVNNSQAHELARLAGEALPERGGLLVDAFAGVGTFAAIFASRFESVIAIEESDSAARDARENLALFPNVELRIGKVERVLPDLEVRPDAVLLDPPRPGCMPEVIAALVAFAPRSIVYVSCNPATLARDLRLLQEGGFTIGQVTPVDMFPQTAHIECVATLSRPDVG